MSGPSTLRLCFAAMAPALTEAASARLKLQDSGTKHRDTRAVKGNCDDSPKADHLTSPRKNGHHEPFALCEIKTTVDRLDLTNGSHGDTVRSSIKGKGGGLNLTSSVVPTSEKNKNNSSVNIGHITSLAVTSKQFSPLIGGGGEDISFRSNGVLVGFKRMNQPYLTAHTNTDQSLESSKSHFNSSDTLRILASKVVSQTGMVNGDNGNDRKKEEEQHSVKKSCVSVRESGDARVNVRSDAKYKIPEQKKGPLKFSLPVESDNIGTSNTMGMCELDSVSLSSKLERQLESTFLAKKCEMEKPCDDVRKDCMKKQAYLERKVEILLRRLKRVKGKVVENHTKEQLAQYVNFQHRNLQMVAKSIKSEAPCPEVFKEHFLSNEDVKNMSTSQLVKLVRDNQSNKSLPITGNSRYRTVNSSASVMSPSLQLQSFGTSDRLSLRVKATENDLDSDATASSSGGESCDEESITCPPKDTALPPILKRAEWKWALERAAIVARWTWLQAQVSDLEYKIRQQSQVHRQLRNSKGGVVLGDPPTAMDILRKLQGFKPGQESSFSPGPATTDGKNNLVQGGTSSTEVSPYNVTRLMSNIDKQASRLTQSLNCISPSSSTMGSPGSAIKVLSPAIFQHVVDSPSSNSMGSTADNSPLVTASSSSFPNHPQQQQSIPEFPSSHLSSLASSMPTSSSNSDASFQAARCRPLRSYRKRKILRTIDLYKTSVKAARLSDVRCRCYPPSNPCAMCGGRYNNTLSMDADNMSFKERVALLDVSFHPVLSFPQDIPLSVHCEGLLKSGLWQNKPHTKRSKSGDYRRQKVMAFAVPESVIVKKSQGNTKISNGRGNASAPSVINFTAKIKNKYEGKTKAKKTGAMSRTAPLKHKVNKANKKAVKISKAMKKKKKMEEEAAGDLEALYLEQEVSCPSTSREDRLSNSASGSGLRDSQTPTHRRRKVDNAFDINNIEIPHSIAASTRVEQIQYKEIVTPKWRVVAEGPSSPPWQGNDVSLSSPVTACPPVDPDPLVMTVTVSGKVLERTNGVSLLSMECQDKMVSPTMTTSEELDQEIEDLSDEAYLRRHSIPEQEERKRFRNFLQYPPIRRNRARSDAFLTTATLPVPECDDGDVPGEIDADLGDGGDSSLPAVTATTMEELSDQPQASGRRRSLLVAASKRERSVSAGPTDAAHVTSIDPWPRRPFPLSEGDYTRMQSESSSNCEPLHQEVSPPGVAHTEPSGKVYVEGPDDGWVPSPHPNVEWLGDDPTDPDWVTTSTTSRYRKTSHTNPNVADPDWTGSDNPKKGKKR